MVISTALISGNCSAGAESCAFTLGASHAHHNAIVPLNASIALPSVTFALLSCSVLLVTAVEVHAG